METHQSATTYENLPPHSIRLLRLDTSASESIVGSLHVVDLDTAPSYYAVSHCWGNQSQTIPILIGAKKFLVCPDLAAGIRRLRELSTETSQLVPPVQYVWIDNICINQQDVYERSRQLRYMGDIYSRSVRTLIWLGPSSATSASAWELVQTLYTLFKEQYEEVVDLDNVAVKMFSDKSHSANRLAGMETLQWLYLKEIFQIPWFSRIWVVQEVVLSRKDPMILHGHYAIPWQRLEGAAYWLRRNGYVRLTQTAEEILNVDVIGLLRRSQVRWPLDALLSVTQMKFHASDQRDKIYGLYGLAAETHDSSKQPAELVVDYTLDVAQTYRRVAHYLLQHNKSLAVLTRIRGTQESLSRTSRQYDFADFPSWLPDWSDFSVYGRDIRRSFSWVYSSDSTKTPSLGYPEHYNASAGLPTELHQSSNDSILRISGMRVDVISQVIPLNRALDGDESNQAFTSNIRDVCEAVLPMSAGKDMIDWTEALIKTISAEQHNSAGYSWQQFSKDGLAYLFELLSSKESQMSPTVMESISVKTLEVLQQKSLDGKPLSFAAIAQNFCFNRSFIITSAGRMGLGPSDSRLGDIIAIIPGSGVPLIMRRLSNDPHWLLVGESYVQGLMNGEAINHSEVGDFKREILAFK
ncbi:hypothetical protein PFICI_12973 [Pestalotiopsis fici W106-1]|uniref:Heterokaryon incompatibility domain-containing protein n=1 Tax=Pestalotiopsis fici (strain W106-1 / CGMCC3.15140) TaxID=1229662 RepID=W3WQE5_PESFW|nr:uncharacterized protein PFICI_12973 [Pestalotiopsis fici W106-1]ETS76029.1 hypothetical protein PFICI_12973 [Pestalotiopsis fici W106-1]